MGVADQYEWRTPGEAALAELFYRHVDPNDLAGRGPEAIGGCVEHLLATVVERPAGQAVVDVANPTVEQDGWTCGRTVVTVATDDMAFLVDSVTAELTRLEVGIQLVVHPIVAVSRDPDGTLESAEPPDVGSDSEPTLPSGEAVGGLESWIHIEVDWQADPKVLVEIRTNLERVLSDVRRAVDDWPRMVAQARGLATELVATPPRGIAKEEVNEAVDLLNWLADHHFTFLGYREYQLVGGHDGPDGLALVSEPGGGLGLLRSGRAESVSFADLPAEVRRRALDPTLLILTKANRRSTVHRRVYLDYVGVKSFDRTGRVVGERRFIGLFSSAAYYQSVRMIPVIDRKVRLARNRMGYARDSHSGRDLRQFLETFPRDELFAIDVDELVVIAEAVLNIKERRATRLFTRRDPYGRFLSCLIYLPRDRYNTDVRLRIQALLSESLGSETVEFTARVTESVLARLHVVVRMPSGVSVPDVDVAALEAGIARIARSWVDDLNSLLVASSSEAGALVQLRRFPEGFPDSYRASTTPAEAVEDLAELDAMTAQQPVRVALQHRGEGSGATANARLKLYALTDISLADVLPVLTAMGVQVVTERPFRLTRRDARGALGTAFIYDFGLRSANGSQLVEVERLWEEAFLAAWDGRAEVDAFQGLVAAAGLDWRRIGVLRAYSRYLRQAGTTFSQEYIEAAVLANPTIAGLLVRLFEVRFDPDLDEDRVAVQQVLIDDLDARLDEVASLDHDRILRSFRALILATTRTNHFQPDRPALAVKLDPAGIRELPRPRPRFEVWVCSPRVEGVHMRFGKVARGGLRWSDRREDFRTEILGLAKAQEVKNALIVPLGAKGGFYPKRLPPPAQGDERLAEGLAAYREFVSSLLDVTDNLVGTQVAPPERVVRHDADDTYLVVAADKGTATFSDVANQVAAEHGYWLGDAFASGGSAGYDHRRLGITARGVWESVRSHFRTLGVRVDREPISVAGVGDMSGDVFGNGMLQSQQLRLVAAFDHRHVFLDPDPGPAAAYQERRRLFDLPRSSWADYSRDLISRGGGVFPRSAKAIPVGARVREVLGITAAAGRTMTPSEVVRAILSAPVDLLWNGGIGTFVKATGESHGSVGDRANDAIRINAPDLRARVVAEGGNLGLTQRARSEAARRGVLLNTDAFDNSAGVDTSDHEVNIKVLLDRVIAAGDLDPQERVPLLESMADEVARLVLRDNIEQNVLVHLQQAAGPGLLPTFARLIRELERTAGLDRVLEALPDDETLAGLVAEGGALTAPELAVVIAYTKLALKVSLLGSAVPDEPFSRRWLHGYFPEELSGRFAEHLGGHPLSRQIVATALANEMVNRGGATFVLRAAEETGAGAAEVARSYAVSCRVFGVCELWERIEQHEGDVPTAVLNAMRAEVHRLLDRSTRWFLQTRGGTLDVPGEVDRFADPVARLAGSVPAMLPAVERDRLSARIADLEERGAPQDLAAQVAVLLEVFALLDIVEVSRRTQEEPEAIAQMYFALSERFDVDRYLTRITSLPRGDRWAALARSALRSDLYGALAALTSRVARATPEGGPAEQRVAAWEKRNAEGLARARATLAEIGAQESFDLATLSVAMRVMRTLAIGG